MTPAPASGSYGSLRANYLAVENVASSATHWYIIATQPTDTGEISISSSSVNGVNIKVFAAGTADGTVYFPVSNAAVPVVSATNVGPSGVALFILMSTVGYLGPNRTYFISVQDSSGSGTQYQLSWAAMAVTPTGTTTATTTPTPSQSPFSIVSLSLNVPVTLSANAGVYQYASYTVVADDASGLIFQLNCNPVGSGMLYLSSTSPSSAYSFSYQINAGQPGADQSIVMSASSNAGYVLTPGGIYYLGVS